MEYLSTLLKQSKKVLASSLTRIWQHATQNDYPIAMLTAFRKTDENGKLYKLIENRMRNKKLMLDLKALGYSYIPMEGHYVEGYKTENAQDLTEESFFVIGKDKEDFEKNIFELGKKYNQESVMLKLPDSPDAFLLGTRDTNPNGEKSFPGLGNKETLGPFHPQKIDIFYSKWKNKTFIFKNIGNDYSGKSGCALDIQYRNEIDSKY